MICYRNGSHNTLFINNLIFKTMKKAILLAAGAVLLAATVSTFVYVKNGSDSMDELFDANVEALTQNEDDLSSAIWIRSYRQDGGYNCTKGGDETC